MLLAACLSRSFYLHAELSRKCWDHPEPPASTESNSERRDWQGGSFEEGIETAGGGDVGPQDKRPGCARDELCRVKDKSAAG